MRISDEYEYCAECDMAAVTILEIQTANGSEEEIYICLKCMLKGVKMLKDRIKLEENIADESTGQSGRMGSDEADFER